MGRIVHRWLPPRNPRPRPLPPATVNRILKETMTIVKTRVPALLCILLFCRGAVCADPASYRTGKPDPRIAGVPAEIRQAISTQPDETVAPLVHWLVRDVKDDFLKVKILHDWVAENIDYDAESYFAGGLPESSWKAGLAHRKAVCQGYAELFQKLCRIAGVPCEVISGYGRGLGFAIGQAENVRQSNHAWNAVKIEDRWRLLDVTWDAGHVRGRSYHKQYGTSYLFAEPRHFLHTHFPTEAKWQLLDRPLSAEEFAALPLLEGRFFASGLRLSTTLRRLHPVGESVQFSVAVPEDVSLTASLVEPGKSEPDKREPQRLGGRTLVRRGRNEVNVLVTFPAAGRWGVEVFTKSRQEQGPSWRAATLEFEANAGTAWTFAESYGSVEGMDSFLESPLYVPLAAGTDQQFKIRVRNAEQVQLLVGPRKWIPMQRASNDPELYQVTTLVPADTSVQIVALPPRRGNRYWTLVDFTPDRK